MLFRSDSNYLTTIEFLENTSIAMISLDGMQNLLKSFSHKGAEKIMEEILKKLHQHMVHLEDRILMLQTYSATPFWDTPSHPTATGSRLSTGICAATISAYHAKNSASFPVW